MLHFKNFKGLLKAKKCRCHGPSGLYSSYTTEQLNVANYLATGVRKNSLLRRMDDYMNKHQEQESKIQIAWV